jgi:hypothetical protein
MSYYIEFNHGRVRKVYYICLFGMRFIYWRKDMTSIYQNRKAQVDFWMNQKSTHHD